MTAVLLFNLAGLLSFCLPLVWPCSVSIHPKAPVVPFGGSVKLNCTATCTNYTKMEWEVSFARDVEEGEGWISLNIKNVTEWTPQPLCLAKYKGSGSIHTRAVIYVYEFSTPDIYLASEIKSGHSERIICNISSLRVRDQISPNVNISLIRGTILLNSSYGQASLEYSFVANLNRDDGEEIICAAQVQVGSEVLNKSATRTLKVVASPYNISISTNHMTYQANTNIVMTCEAEGKPFPEFLWDLPSKASVGFSNNNKTLMIHSAQSFHNGTYRCLAYNMYGKKSAQIDILFQERSRSWIVALVVVALLAVVFTVGIFWYHCRK
ncbi:vascular cell adhesion protein 1-like [Sceloporus undulatus]|uniref:vascular cell adhesion protein 1-like n=1 Tax=Sceloporus undulatus TaxID=8520 RepID=UPI001C4B0F33|nr:vascular cell adhesion protein 1-like [Sceloporus undulatus]